jgi:hypothetical protein
MDATEREVEGFKGKPAVIEEAPKSTAPIGRKTSERVDEKLAKSIE